VETKTQIDVSAIITAAAQSNLGILALLVVALSVLAYFFFASASEKTKVGIFAMLFMGVVGFGVAMFRSVPEPRLIADVQSEPDSAKEPSRQAATLSSVAVAAPPSSQDLDATPQDQSVPSCRHPDNGFERWGSSSVYVVDSEVQKDNDFDVAAFCRAALKTRQNEFPSRSISLANPNFEIVLLEDGTLGKRFKCNLIEQSDPIYRLAKNAKCE
jgi:hypothetical protein